MSPTLLRTRSILEEIGVVDQSALPEVIGSSWQRTLNLGLDPVSAPIAKVVSSSELRQRSEKLDSVMRFIRPELELLSTQVAGPNFLVAAADADGIVLDVIIDEQFKKSVCGKEVPLGANFAEDQRGTNAIGTALFTG